MRRLIGAFGRPDFIVIAIQLLDAVFQDVIVVYVRNQKDEKQELEREQKDFVQKQVHHHRKHGEHGKQHGYEQMNQPFMLKKLNLYEQLLTVGCSFFAGKVFL